MSDSNYDVKKISQLKGHFYHIGQLQCILASHWLIFILRHNQSQTLLVGSMLEPLPYCQIGIKKEHRE